MIDLTTANEVVFGGLDLQQTSQSEVILLYDDGNSQKVFTCKLSKSFDSTQLPNEGSGKKQILVFMQTVLQSMHVSQQAVNPYMNSNICNVTIRDSSCCHIRELCFTFLQNAMTNGNMGSPNYPR